MAWSLQHHLRMKTMHLTTHERYAFFLLDTIWGFFIRYDTISIQYVGLKKDLLFKEFSANFQNFRRIFWIFGEFSEFPENFQNFQRIFRISGIFGGKRQNKSISRYSILEVQYHIFFDTLKVLMYRHSIISRYDKPTLAFDH